MLSLQNSVLVTSAAYLLFTPTVSAQGSWWGNGNGDGNGYGCPPWMSSDECNNNNGGSSSSGSSSSASDNSFNASIQQQSRIITIHAILACLVWVFLIPLGGILIRLGIRSPWIVRIHAILQSLSFVIYFVAAGLGIWLIRQLSDGDSYASYSSYSLWDDPHPKIGVGILVAAFFQPIFGLIHHTIYKRRVAATKAGRPTKPPGRTAIGTIHLWLGRLLIVLGVINGGLGLRLASYTDFAGNTRTKAIAYGIGSGIMLLLYFIFIVRGEIRRSKGLKESKRQADEANRNNVPLLPMEAVQARGPPPPLYTAGHMSVPPSYEDSQMGGSASGQTNRPTSMVKEAHTTARYH